MLVDTNILVDVFEEDPDWVSWSVSQLELQSKTHKLLINPIIYAELSLAFYTSEALDAAIEPMLLELIEIPKSALFLAGKAFVKYRHQGGTKHNVLSDFFIGAHAAVCGLSLLTRDTKRYRTYFPSVRLVTP